jgi:hypothetical protein
VMPKATPEDQLCSKCQILVDVTVMHTCTRCDSTLCSGCAYELLMRFLRSR